MSFGEKFVLLLKNSGKSQGWFASEVGMDYTHVNKFATGNRRPSLDFINNVLKVFPNVDLNWLLRDELETESTGVSEPQQFYSLDLIKIIEEAQGKLELVKEALTQK